MIKARRASDPRGLVIKELTDFADETARKNGLYNFIILKTGEHRNIQIQTSKETRWVVDFATNGPFALNVRKEIFECALEAIRNFGAVHSSIAAARAETGLVAEIADHLCRLKGEDSCARVYPTTFAANIATASGLAKADCTAIVHPNVHATVHSALKSSFDSKHLVYTKNTAQVATALAATSKRTVVVVEDGLYSMGKFADFQSIKGFLDTSPNGFVWFDDAHSFGLIGHKGRGQAMEEMENYSKRCIVTGSFGKALGAAGGFMVGPSDFVKMMMGVSVSDRFSCNLDLAGQGATMAALKYLAQPNQIRELQEQLQARLEQFDQCLLNEGLTTEQQGSSIAYRVIPFASSSQAISIAGQLLQNHGFLTTPVYFPTIARGNGAIRVSLSVSHKTKDLENLTSAIGSLLKSCNAEGYIPTDKAG